jgi:hypothetical protein
MTTGMLAIFVTGTNDRRGSRPPAAQSLGAIIVVALFARNHV